MLVILLGSWTSSPPTRFQMSCKEIWGESHFHLQLANGSNLCKCCFRLCSLVLLFLLKRAFFDWVSCKVSRGHDGLCGKTVFSCSAFWFCFLFPLPLRLQNKESTLGQMGIWSPMAGLDVVQICSDVVSDVVHITWDFQATSLLSTCRPLEKAAEQLSFQQSWFAYCCLKQRMFWQSLWRPGSQPTAQRWLPTPLPERSFRCQI